MQYGYKKSFLIFWHIVLSALFILYTIALISGYSRNVIVGSTISISILILYLLLLKKSINLFNNQQIGGAYFLTIGGFLLAVFIQAITCTNSVDFASMH